jgi:hypothetical protein
MLVLVLMLMSCEYECGHVDVDVGMGMEVDVDADVCAALPATRNPKVSSMSVSSESKNVSNGWTRSIRGLSHRDAYLLGVSAAFATVFMISLPITESSRTGRCGNIFEGTN